MREFIINLLLEHDLLFQWIAGAYLISTMIFVVFGIPLFFETYIRGYYKLYKCIWVFCFIIVISTILWGTITIIYLDPFPEVLKYKWTHR